MAKLLAATKASPPTELHLPAEMTACIRNFVGYVPKNHRIRAAKYVPQGLVRKAGSIGRKFAKVGIAPFHIAPRWGREIGLAVFPFETSSEDNYADLPSRKAMSGHAWPQNLDRLA